MSIHHHHHPSFIFLYNILLLPSNRAFNQNRSRHPIPFLFRHLFLKFPMLLESFLTLSNLNMHLIIRHRSLSLNRVISRCLPRQFLSFSSLHHHPWMTNAMWRRHPRWAHKTRCLTIYADYPLLRREQVLRLQGPLPAAAAADLSEGSIQISALSMNIREKEQRLVVRRTLVLDRVSARTERETWISGGGVWMR